MTFIYEHDLYCLEIYRISKYELIMSRLPKVIIRQRDIHRQRETESMDIIINVASQVVKYS